MNYTNDCILSVNAGSSTVKLGLFKSNNIDENVGFARLEILENKKSLIYKGKETTFGLEEPNMDIIMSWLQKNDINIIAIGHRIVHGGLHFTKLVPLESEETINKIKELGILAPLHQYSALEYINNFKNTTNIPQFAYFDTAFHTSVPRVARLFAIPRKYIEDGVMKYGFHGIAYESALMHVNSLTHGKGNSSKIVALHLGNGCSMCAINNGKSIDTTMGFTAIDGVMMGTRCGRLDPGIVFFLSDHYGLKMEEIEHILYKESGLKGLSGISNDIRELSNSKSENAKEAIDVFCHMAVKEMFSLIGVLGGIDIVVFSGGIGQNSSLVRSKICNKLEFMGLNIDVNRNNNNESVFSSEDSKILACVADVSEEKVIAFHIVQFLKERY